MRNKEDTKSKSVNIGRPTVSYAQKLQRRSTDAVRFHYVYILKCKNNLPYVGCTDNLKERKTRHDKGQINATKNRLPVKIISYFAFSNRYVAFNFEKYLKSGSGRAFVKRHKLV